VKGVKIATVVKAMRKGHVLKQIAALLMQSERCIQRGNRNEAEGSGSPGKAGSINAWGMFAARSPVGVSDEWPTISSIPEAELFSAEGKRQGKIVKIQIKIDTGMGRLGVWYENAFDFINYCRNLAQIKVVGIFTHFSSAEDDKDFTQLQKTRFLKVLSDLKKSNIEIPLVHSNNSAGIIHEKDTTLIL
jgi:alanine racemase